MVASYKFSISFSVNIIQPMIVDLKVCGLLDFHKGNFLVQIGKDKVLTLHCDSCDRLAAASACTVRKHHC